MTAIKFVPIPLDVAARLLVLLRAYGAGDTAFPLVEIHSLQVMLGEAISIAGEHFDANAMLCAELLELIGRVTGRRLSTIPGPGSLTAAANALSETVPLLGDNVLRLPPVPERASAEAIDAAVVRGLADMPGPIALRPFVARKQRPREPSYDELDTVDVWAVPHKGEPWCGYVVYGVDWDSPKSVRLFLKPMPGEGEPF
jgi:hypothetical protein